MKNIITNSIGRLNSRTNSTKKTINWKIDLKNVQNQKVKRENIWKK